MSCRIIFSNKGKWYCPDIAKWENKHKIIVLFKDIMVVLTCMETMPLLHLQVEGSVGIVSVLLDLYWCLQ